MPYPAAPRLGGTWDIMPNVLFGAYALESPRQAVGLPGRAIIRLGVYRTMRWPLQPRSSKE